MRLHASLRVASKGRGYVLSRLFQTLDPTLRQAELPSGRQVILSDTVGFIDKLPPSLIKAFQVRICRLKASCSLLPCTTYQGITCPSQWYCCKGPFI